MDVPGTGCNIRIVEGDHDIEGRVDGSAMMLKAIHLRKVWARTAASPQAEGYGFGAIG